MAPAHLDRPFDYRIPAGEPVQVGSRVRVVFAGRRRVGWVVAVADFAETDTAKIRDLTAVDGTQTWFDEGDLRLLRWVADRYAATMADVLRHAMPPRVAAVESETWPDVEVSLGPPHDALWEPYDARGLLAAVSAAAGATAPAFWLRPTARADRGALVGDLVARCLAAGRTALVLGADPASTGPDAAADVAAGLAADLRTDAERARYRAFLRCRRGHARVAVGERSAAFAPLHDLGLVIVDDEANPAYKERRSPRHHTREVALARARMAGAVCVLVGDLPSAPLVRLLDEGHVLPVAGHRAAERDDAPRVDVVDLGDPRPGARRTRLTGQAARCLTDTVRAGGRAVVLASRGGQGAALVCRGCRRRLACPVCSGSLAVARDDDWRCPACAWTGPAFACPDCGDTRHAPLAAGAGRLAAELRRGHPDADVVRMEGYDADGPRSAPAIGVMTRGSVVAAPRWLDGSPADVVVVADADAMLRRPGFDAAEDALRLWMAAARWARRMVVQTREPGHHAVQALVRWDPSGFWERERSRRGELRLPPTASLIAVTAPDAAAAQQAADELRQALPDGDEVLGPDLGGGVLVKTSALRTTLAALRPLREDWAKHDRKLRVDVDPLL